MAKRRENRPNNPYERHAIDLLIYEAPQPGRPIPYRALFGLNKGPFLNWRVEKINKRLPRLSLGGSRFISQRRLPLLSRDPRWTSDVLPPDKRGSLLDLCKDNNGGVVVNSPQACRMLRDLAGPN